MTETQAREFVQKYQTVIQKIRSNVLDAMCKGEEPSNTMKMVLDQIHPLVFSDNNELNLLMITQKILKKKFIEPIDVYNLILLGHKSLAVGLMADMRELRIPEVHPLPEWLSGWEGEEND